MRARKPSFRAARTKPAAPIPLDGVQPDIWANFFSVILTPRKPNTIFKDAGPQ